MAKPVLVLSSAAVAAGSRAPAAAARGDADRGGADDRRPAANGSGRGVEAGSISTKVEDNPHRSEGHSSDDASVDFGEIFGELLRYRGENGGSLAIPASHPTLARIIDIQFDLGMEGLAKRRWDDRLAALKRFGEDNGGSCADVPPHHRGLGSWVAIQRKHFDLHARGMTSALTRKRFAKLTAAGFGREGARDGAKAKVDGHKRKKAATHKAVKNGIEKRALKTKDDETDREEEDGRKNPQKGNRKRATKTNVEHGVEWENGGDTPSNAVEKDDGGKSEPSPARMKKDTVFKTETPEADVSVRAPPNGHNRKQISDKADVGVKVAKIEGRCDVCEKSDGWWGDNLQKCRDCGLLVHEQCYGMRETDTKDPDFTCYACKAVGTDVEVNVPSKLGGCGNRMGEKRELIYQEKRPTECVLCSHDKGVHAMHPLLDTHGPEGRQLVIERSVWGEDGLARKERKLAWVHTLCANFICSNPKTAGCVYGCMRDGSYEVDQEDTCEEEECVGEDYGSTTDAESNAIFAEQGDEDDFGKVAEQCQEDVRYYTIATGEGYDKIINDHRSLKCFVCGIKDKAWKIPVQCPAGETEEYERWKDRHQAGTVCFVAMHVGCARWGCVEPEGSHLETIGGKRCRLCYFYPGRDAEDIAYAEKSQTVAHCYCKAHARDIVQNHPNRKKPGNERSSLAGKVKSSDPGGKSAQHSAQASFKKSLNSLRHRKGNKNISIKGKKKSGAAAKYPKRAFGASSPKEVKVGFMQENTLHYPVRGRSASALAGISGQGGQMCLDLAKDNYSGVSNPSYGKLHGKQRQTVISDLPLKAEPPIASPDLGTPPVNGDEKVEKWKRKRLRTDPDGANKQTYGKRKTGQDSDCARQTSSKRMKIED